MVGSLAQHGLRVRSLGGGLLGLLGLQVALNLEFAQVAEQRPRFAGEPIGFTLQGADTIRNAFTRRG